MQRTYGRDQFIGHGKLGALLERCDLMAEAALEKAQPYLTAMKSRWMAPR